MSDSWYSDAALAKQAEVERKQAAGERVLWSDLLGIEEPRTQPTDAERCFNCSADARDEAGGAAFMGRRWCSLCIDRDRHLPWDHPATTHPTPFPPEGQHSAGPRCI